MDLISKTDEEIREIAEPLWNDLIRHSNNKDYGGFTKDFSKSMLMGASEVELGKQWANNKVLSNLSDDNEIETFIKSYLNKAYIRKVGKKPFIKVLISRMASD